VLPLARSASGSVGRAATALHNWALTLGSLQDEAKALDRQAEPHRTDLEAALRASGLPATATPPYPAKLTSAQTARVNTANTALSGILARANDLHTRYLDAVRAANSQLDNAGNMAPHPPGLFSSLWHDASAFADDIGREASRIVHDKALLEFISGVANAVATVAGMLALIPILTPALGPIALSAAVVALGADVLLAGFDHDSWKAVAWDALSVVADAAWIKAASRLSVLYKEAGLEKSMTRTRSLIGLVTGKETYVAPGMFRMIGASLKEAAGGTNAVVADMNKLAIKDFAGSAIWRSVDITAGQLNWTPSTEAIEAIPSNVRTWVNDIATGKAPWEGSANKATGL
jgi:hypothetical protein